MSDLCTSEAASSNIINIIYYSENAFSLLGSAIVLLTYIILPKLRKTCSMRYIAYLNIANLYFGIASILIYYFNDFNIYQTDFNQCLGFIFFYFYYSTLIWPLIFAINLYQIVEKHKSNISRYEIHYLCIGFVVPLILVATYQYLGWLESTFNPTIISGLLMTYIPIFIILAITSFIYIKLIIAFKTIFNEKEAKSMIIQILPYPLITFILVICLLIFQIEMETQPCITFIEILIGSLKNLQGIADAFVYGFNPVVQEEIKIYFNKKNNKQNLHLSMNFIAS